MRLEATIRLNKPFALQRAILNDPTRFKVLAIGQQWGKSELSVIDGVHRLLRGQSMWFASPTNKNNKRVYPKFKSVLGGIPGVYTNDTDMLVRMPNGGFIQFVSLDAPDNLRGAGLDQVYIDEAAFIKQGVFDKVLRPMLAVRQGSAWFMSSPNGRNEFWQWKLRGDDSSEKNWQSWHLPSSTSPFMTQAELDDIRRNTPERVFRQEYLAEFLEDGGAVFRSILSCVDESIVIDKLTQTYPTAQGDVVMGVDWGRHNDYTVLVAIDTASMRVVDFDRFNEIDWTLQRGRLEAMARRWNATRIEAEANSIGEPNIEELRKAGLPVHGFTTTAGSKQQVINALALAFEQNDISIPKNETLIGELQAYTIERLPSGNLRYTAPAGLHDDTVIALALAWHAAHNRNVVTTSSVMNWYADYRG